MDAPRKLPALILPHAEFGDPKCCGLLLPVFNGHEAQFVCNECSAIARTVPAGQLSRTIALMEFEMGGSSVACPHCGAANALPFSEALMFTCRSCGRGVDLTK